MTADIQASPNLPGMSVIVHKQMNKLEAEQITQEIQDRVADLTLLVLRAFQGKAHKALGYESWDAYVKARFHDAPLYLPRDDRRAVVALLRGHGMSTRNIASVTGVGQQTVVRDIAATDSNESVEVIHSEDGRSRPAKRKPKPDARRETDRIKQGVDRRPTEMTLGEAIGLLNESREQGPRSIRIPETLTGVADTLRAVNIVTNFYDAIRAATMAFRACWSDDLLSESTAQIWVQLCLSVLEKPDAEHPFLVGLIETLAEMGATEDEVAFDELREFANDDYEAEEVSEL